MGSLNRRSQNETAVTGDDNMANSELDGNILNQDRQFDSNERREMAQLDIGIGFDGRYYTYKEYRYDLCSDAVNYARLDRSRPTYRATGSIPPPWKKPEEPTDEEQRLMKELGVTFDGKYYRYGSYRYDRLADALCYAESEQ
jgi:hypothetical protein